MKLAVISDIHGNFTALETVLDDLSRQKDVNLTWCLGDLAAFGPQPSACVQRIKALSETDDGKTFKVIGGNTELYLVNGVRLRADSAKDEETFQKLAENWQIRDTLLNWCVGKLTWEEYEYLKQIRNRELAYEVPDYGWVIGYHGVPGDDEAFLRPDTPEEQVIDFLLDREGRLGIGGHTHQEMERKIAHWHVVNVGSVGMSFTKPGTAFYGIFTFTNGAVEVEIREIPYDVDRFIDEAQQANYPNIDWLKDKFRL